MNRLTLIDSSAWIGYFRAKLDPEIAEEIRENLRTKTVAMAAPIWFELYQGVRSRREDEDLKSLREVSNWLDIDDLCWETAAQNGRVCLRAGVNVPFGDLLVHACARRYQVKLLHCDKHFEMIDAACPV